MGLVKMLQEVRMPMISKNKKNPDCLAISSYQVAYIAYVFSFEILSQEIAFNFFVENETISIVLVAQSKR